MRCGRAPKATARRLTAAGPAGRLHPIGRGRFSRPPAQPMRLKTR